MPNFDLKFKIKVNFKNLKVDEMGWIFKYVIISIFISIPKDIFKKKNN